MWVATIQLNATPDLEANPARAPDGEGVILARLDYERLQRLRRELPCLRHGRLP